ncbi:MAG: sphingomyelin phosphodiesterase [Myxococcota bacterium]|nr:sphingomyelin phosphodiesterase [Myxococcota bacterium]
MKSLGFLLIAWFSIFSNAATAAPDLDTQLKPASINQISVVLYNAYLKPWPFGTADAAYRAQHMTEAMSLATQRVLGASWPDVIVIAEGFDDHLVGERALGPRRLDGYLQCQDDRACELKRSLWLSGYRWITENVGTEGRAIQDGGVFIASRYPIESVEKLIYDDYSCTDRFADKGAIYAKIQKSAQTVHVFGTHLQASYFHSKSGTLLKSCRDTLNDDGVDFEHVREKQLHQLATFIEAQEIPDDELIVLAGDMNIPRSSQEYLRMNRLLNTLALEFRSNLAGGQLSTFDNNTNALKQCRKELAANDRYRRSCGEFDFAPSMWNDYVLFRGGANLVGRPVNSVLEIEYPRHRDLSDHHAVLGVIEVR